MDLFNDLLNTLIASPWIILLVLALCVIDGFFPPVPSETTVVAVLAAAVASGAPVIWVLAITATAGVGAIAGDSIAYWIGHRIGIERFRWFQRPAVKRVTDWVTQRVHSSPAALILVGRYIPGGRVAVNMLAGTSHLRYRRFLTYSVIAGVSWAATCVAVATLSAAWLGNPLWSALLSIAIMLLLGVGIDHIARRRSHARAAAHSPELDDEQEVNHEEVVDHVALEDAALPDEDPIVAGASSCVHEQSSPSQSLSSQSAQ